MSNLTHDIIRFLSRLSDYELGLVEEIKKRSYKEGREEKEKEYASTTEKLLTIREDIYHDCYK